MELKFETLDYQQTAVEAAAALFEGQPENRQLFDLEAGNAALCVANRLDLDWETIAANMHAVQKANGQPETDIGTHGLNFSIEMETGTGKTYVYLNTIYELNRRYGWKKFVIVVPSVPIREGVLQSLNGTKNHFAARYGKPVCRHTEYARERLSALKAFAESGGIEILVINIQSFEKDGNVINQPNESGDAPIKHIQNTRPIVIIDEPQNMEGEARLKAIESLNPLFTLRYSATHKKPRHKLYSLNPVQAYNLKLVKQIEVDSVLAENDVNGAFVEIVEIKPGKRKITAKLNIHHQDKKGTKKKTVSVAAGDDLFEKSGYNPAYRHGFGVDGMDIDTWEIEFSGGLKISRGSNGGAVRDEIMKTQIRRTVAEHLKKEKRLNPLGIKVLSLFFIDEVKNYLGEDKLKSGKFARWFEEVYRELSNNPNTEGVHNGYFSGMKKNGSSTDFSAAKNTTSRGAETDDAYHLIMCDKESLLSFDSPLRFIFSHSALKEGWDNPNVFQICTLNESLSHIKKRQEIGRGLRLPVNQKGERIRNEAINILTVVPNESYQSFAQTLQKEYEDECGVKFAASNIKDSNRKKKQVFRKNFMLDPEFQAIWNKLKYKTRYRVHYDTAELIKQAATAVKSLPEIQKPKIRSQKARLEQSETYGIETVETASRSRDIAAQWNIPDILGEIQKKTGLTRRTVFEIITRSGRLNDVTRNPQRFIDLAAEAINRSLHALMAAGIEYKQTGKVYDQKLLQDMEQNGIEFYANDFTFAVGNPQKTICENYIPLDSDTEKTFAADCENYDAQIEGGIAFYFKLPSWFKIPTPLGHYNPDWAVVKQFQDKVYFVAETKNTGKGIQSGVDSGKLRAGEQLKIECGKRYFDTLDGIRYQAVEKIDELE